MKPHKAKSRSSLTWVLAHDKARRGGMSQKKMVDNIGTTKWQSEFEWDMHHWNHTSTDVCQHNEADTDSPRHKRRIGQWIAGGCIVVIHHCCQDKALSISKTAKEKHLQDTALGRDAFLGCYKIHEHFRSDCCRIADVQERQIAENIIHGSLKARIDINYNY